METKANVPVLRCASARQWDEWLAEHHAQATGVWLIIAKKGSETRSATYSDALDVALSYGWIDGQKKTYDGQYWLQKFTPRRPRSAWSRINTERVDRLIEGGRMKPAGLREVEAARADGRWDAAYASQRTMEVPGDFLVELEKHAEARAFFDSLNKVNRYAVCYRIESAKRPETRAARIRTFVEMLARKQMLHP